MAVAVGGDVNRAQLAAIGLDCFTETLGRACFDLVNVRRLDMPLIDIAKAQNILIL